MRGIEGMYSSNVRSWIVHSKIIILFEGEERGFIFEIRTFFLVSKSI